MFEGMEIAKNTQAEANPANSDQLLCGACGEINIDEITEDNHILCKCGAIYAVSPEVATTANSMLQGSADINLSSPTMTMSDSELLRKIAKHSEESAFVLKRFLFVAQVFAVIWIIGMIIQFIQAAN